MLDQVTDTLAGNLVRQTKTLIPELRKAAIARKKDIRVISLYECVSQRHQKGYRHCEGQISCVGGRHERASTGELDDGGALSLNTTFVNFIKFGIHNKEIEDYKEVGERFLSWED